VLTGMLAASASVGTAGSALALNTSPTVHDRTFDFQLTFSEFPVGELITDDYWEHAIAPIVFNAGFITADGSNPTSPVLVPGSDRRITAAFQNGTYPVSRNALVRSLRFDVGYLDQPHTIEIRLYAGSNLVLRKRNRRTGIVTFRFLDLPTPISRFNIRNLTDEPAGWGIDNLMFKQPTLT
jgi:hypothetical protein